MHVLSRIRRDERGVTLIELLATMAIGLVVLFAVLGLMTTMVRSSASSRGREQAVREGRTALDRIGQELRLASCPDSGSAVISGDGSSVSYYVERPQGDYTLAPVVERHTLTYTATTQRLVLTVSTGTGVPPTWSATPTRQSTVGSRLALVGTTPFFQYLSYDSPTAPDTSLIATSPLGASDLPNVAQVRVTFNALPDYGDATAAGSRFESTVVLRTDDPTDEDNTPQC
jgi:prepilin-type N-terminal cleavage/methylation domain-containing protein